MWRVEINASGFHFDKQYNNCESMNAYLRGWNPNLIDEIRISEKHGEEWNVYFSSMQD